MTQTKLDRLRARGSVRIDADSDGYAVAWWPKGQAGNPFCGRGDRGPVLEELVAHIEEATRPAWYADVDDVRAARERKAEHDRAERQRLALRHADMDDRRREKRAREAEAWRVKRRAEIARQERERVKRMLA